MTTFSSLWQYLAEFLSEWEIFKIQVIEKIETRVLCSATFFWKSCRLWDNVERCSGDREATDNMAPAGGMLDKATCAQAHTDGREPTHTHTPTPTRARTHTHRQTDQYAILTAFPRQQLFRERALVLRHRYIVCLVKRHAHSNLDFTRHAGVLWKKMEVLVFVVVYCILFFLFLLCQPSFQSRLQGKRLSEPSKIPWISSHCPPNICQAKCNSTLSIFCTSKCPLHPQSCSKPANRRLPLLPVLWHLQFLHVHYFNNH